MSHDGVSFTKIQTAIFKTIGAAIEGNVCTKNNILTLTRSHTPSSRYTITSTSSFVVAFVLRTNDVTDFQPHCCNNPTRIKWYTIVIDELSHSEWSQTRTIGRQLKTQSLEGGGLDDQQSHAHVICL